ncbi:MAG: hypothetical protein HC892_01425 [Saprospiraceae bacterium]|nr:hypothetical protein [Saprospiraceae bacterium]
MKVSNNFTLQEFVSESVYVKFGNNSIWFIDQKIINIAQLFRTIVDKSVTINNWHNKGSFNESGLRDFSTSTGVSFSQHKFGRAVDLKVDGMTGDQMRKIVIDNKIAFLQIGLTTIEDKTPTWLHCDCRNTGLKDLLIVPFK